jgi:hypothetical protein
MLVKKAASTLQFTFFCALAASASACAGLGANPGGGPARADLSAAQNLRPAPGATGGAGDLFYVAGGLLHRIKLTGNPGNQSKGYGESPAASVTIQHTGGIYEAYGDPAHDIPSAVAILTQQLDVVRSIPLTAGTVPRALAVNVREQSFVICSFADNPNEFVIEVLMSSAGPDVSPQIIISQPVANLGNPTAIAIDNQGDVYVAITPASGPGPSAILTFVANPVTGAPQLARTIGGPATGLTAPLDLALGADGNIYVANKTATGYDVLVFPMTAGGNVAPLRTLDSSPYGATIALGSGGTLYAGPGATPNQGFAVYSPGASGKDAPVGFLGKPFKAGTFPVSVTLQNPWYEN